MFSTSAAGGGKADPDFLLDTLPVRRFFTEITEPMVADVLAGTIQVL
jgi:hypothetical protein